MPDSPLVEISPEALTPPGGGALTRAAALLGQGRRARVGGLRGSAPAWALARLWGEGARPVLAVCPTPEQALSLYEDLREFLGEDAGLLSPERRSLFHLPAWEQRPSDNRSPAVEHLAARSEALFALLRRPRDVTIVTSVAGLLQKTAPRSALEGRFDYLLAGQEAPFEQLPQRLAALGYRRGPKVEDRGEFAVKGGIVDVFPPGYAHPLRLEFVGERLEGARPFDPVTQRSWLPKGQGAAVEEILLLPMREIFPEGPHLARALAELSREQQEGTAGFRFLTALKEDLSQGHAVAGIEYLLSYFYENPPSLLDHVPEGAWLAVLEPAQIERELEVVGERLASGYERRRAAELPAAKVGDVFAAAGDILSGLRRRAGLLLEELETEEGGTGDGWEDFESLTERTVRAQALLPVAPEKSRGASEGSPLAPLAASLSEWTFQGRRVVIVSHTPSQQERLATLLRPYGIAFDRSEEPHGALASLAGPAAGPLQRREPLHLIRGSLSAGFESRASGLVVLTEEEVTGARRRRVQREAPRLENLLTSLQDLAPGDYVVHAQHGIGKFRKLEHLVVGGQPGDFLLIEYAGGDKLYVPAARIHSVAKYGGAEGYEPPLDKMGGARWQATRRKAREAIHKLAADLLALYAARQVSPGVALPAPDAHFRAFEAAFEFDETPDQARAIEKVLARLQEPRPMDHLICGDVGFGKTEVALRAAFLAVLGKKQVAVLVPTTVLAEQHLLTFRRRFEKEAVRVESLSRLRSAAEQRALLRDLAEGKIDVIVGTHRLLQKDVAFGDLGLLIVDEEQRFGVRHKERLKQFRRSVHVLTLTATPIPRTLHLALSGMLDLSIIATPPQDRLSIRTVVARRSDALVREAVGFELSRGGQVFFLHNRVESIAAEAEALRKILPDARIGVAHGQMKPKDLERAMTGFLRGELQVLLCTAIIENGLDIQNANTLIVDRAAEFGLSQLYQIRGRVGRGTRRACAYFLLPPEGRITEDAEKRLEVLQEYTDLGSGFRIATYDLELRGGGNVLGEEQSGHIAAVGLELYTELLEEAVHELKGEPYHEDFDPEVNLALAAYLPDAYVPDVGEKLSLYKKLSAARSEEGLLACADELIDCYGPPPGEVKNFLLTLRVGLLCRRLNIRALDLRGADLTLTFHQDLSRGVKIDRDHLVALVTSEPQRYRLRPDLRLLIHLPPGEARDLGESVPKILAGLEKRPAAN